MSNVISSQQVSWWETHVFVTALLAQCDTLPYAGTPAWCAMPEDDPRKLLALAVAGVYHVLRMETAQEARAEASRAVSKAVDWPKVSREMFQLNSFREAHPWARRVIE